MVILERYASYSGIATSPLNLSQEAICPYHRFEVAHFTTERAAFYRIKLLTGHIEMRLQLSHKKRKQALCWQQGFVCGGL